MATKSIGLTGRDYSTLAAWASYVNALTLTGPEVAEIYNDGGAVVDTTNITISGYTGASSTNTVTIRPATGQGFKDNVNALTNALRYNASNGAALSNSVISGNVYTFGQWIVLDGLMITNSDNRASTLISLGANSKMRNCIAKCTSGTGFGVVVTGGVNVTLENNVLHASGGGHGIIMNHNSAVITSCLLFGTAGNGIRQQYGLSPAALMKNTAIYGFATDTQQTGNSACANNATDKSAFGGTNWGNNSPQTSITSAEFVSVTSGSEDFRLASGGTKLKNNGGTVSPSTDIIGTARPQGAAYDIGPWELAVGGAELVASLTSTATVSSSLTTQIVLQAGLAVISTIAATMSDLGLNSQIISQSSLSGNLSTSIRLNSGLIATTTVAADLTTSSLIGFDTPPLKNNTGQIYANETSVIVNVYNATTGALIVRKTGLTSDASGIVTVKDVLLNSGTSYAYEVILQTSGRRLPTATAS